MGICKSKAPQPLLPSDLPRREPPGEARLETRPEPRTAPIRILRLAQVIEVTGLGKTKIYELQADGQFPMRVQITTHSVGWVEEEVQAWLERRVAARSTFPRRSAALDAPR